MGLFTRPAPCDDDTAAAYLAAIWFGGIGLLILGAFGVGVAVGAWLF